MLLEDRRRKAKYGAVPKDGAMPHNNLNMPTIRPDVLTRPKLEGGKRFRMASPFLPAGDQPTAIAELVEGVRAGEQNQVLLGASAPASTTG